MLETNTRFSVVFARNPNLLGSGRSHVVPECSLSLLIASTLLQVLEARCGFMSVPYMIDSLQEGNVSEFGGR